MPKSRPDLDIPAYRIVKIMRENDTSVSPPRLAIDYLPIFGRQVLEIRAPFRRRWSFLNKKLQNRRGSRNNRMTIPISYLVLRWKPINEESPHWPLVDAAKINMNVRFEKGIYYDEASKTWFLLCYQVVRDMNHLRRMFIHIFAQYQRELREKDNIRSQLERRVIDEFALMTGLSPSARENMDQFARYIGRRQAEIGNIGAVLEGRNFVANFFGQRIEGLLYAVARNLDNACENMPRITDANMPNMQTRLRPEVAKLDSIYSTNIRRARIRAQREMTVGINLLTTNRAEAYRQLKSASARLKEAAKTIGSWAATISSEEMEEANSYRGMKAS